MKTTNIFLLTFLLLLGGCSLYERFIDNNMYVVNAGYSDWSQAPLRGDVPERGTDLAVIVRHWPENAEPQHIIFENHKSFQPKLTTASDDRVVINARIVRATTKLPRTSQEVEESDRLVYTDKKGKQKYIEIEKWTRIDDDEI
jgi:hypothetical protein